jgi:hypothetical protein
MILGRLQCIRRDSAGPTDRRRRRRKKEKEEEEEGIVQTYL